MMASLGPSSNSAVEEIEGELWHSCAEVGCPVYAQQFDPSSAEPPEAITILQCGTEFRVRMDEAFDDAALRNKSTLVSATLPAVPLSTVRRSSTGPKERRLNTVPLTPPSLPDR